MQMALKEPINGDPTSVLTCMHGSPRQDACTVMTTYTSELFPYNPTKTTNFAFLFDNIDQNFYC